MKLKHFLALLGLVSHLCVFAQDFKKGYLIDKNNKKTEVLFKDADFADITSIEYKTSEKEDYQTIDQSNTVEYGIENDYKFVKKTVRHDKTFNEINTAKEPNLLKEDLFLNVLSEGNVMLYSYYDKGSTKFFYEIENSNEGAIQFIYRKYQSNENKTINENNYFRNQLNNILKCETLQINDFVKLRYRKEDFLKIFEKYNVCKNGVSKVYDNKLGKKVKFKYSAFVGLYQSGFSVDSYYKSEEEKKTTFGLGGEIALVLPSEKFEIFARAEYENYSGESKHRLPSSTVEAYFVLESSFLNFNMGGRYNFILNNKDKIFIEGSVGISMPFDDVDYSVHFIDANTTTNRYASIESTAFFTFGAGYTFNDKFGIVLRADTNRNFFGNTRANESVNFSRIGLNLKYTFN
ncbi:hypothetical protein D3C87_656540 [compost metagenome]